MRLLPYALNHPQAVDDVMRFYVIADIILFVIVIAAMLIFVFKYNHKRHPVATSIPGNVPLEVFWTVIPTLLVLAMFYVGWKAYAQMNYRPKNSLAVKVWAQQWKWSFQYANGKSTDTLYVPKGRPLECLIESRDVIHSFYLPAFREKQDALPDRVRHMMLYPEHLGDYDIICAKYCGLGHADMKTKMVVLPDSVFDAWFVSGSTSMPKVADKYKTTYF